MLQRANLLNRRSRPQEALQVIDRALGVAKTVGNRYQEVRLRLLEGTATRDAGDPRKASQIAQQAIDEATTQKMDNLATSGLIDFGNTYFRRGELKTAEEIFRKALTLARTGKVRRQEARAAISLASLCEQDHRPEEAQTFVNDALPFYKSGGYRRELAQAYGILGGTLQDMGELARATRVLHEGLESALQLQDRQVESATRERLAGCYHDLGDFPAAFDQFDRCVHLLGNGPQAGYAIAQRRHVLPVRKKNRSRTRFRRRRGDPA
jgi:tetratricopeptide (TPR) repeat protein